MKAGWKVKPLGDLVEISSGGTPSMGRPDFWVGDIPWVSPKDMKFAVITDSEDHISEAAVTGSATRLIKSGSLLMVVRSGILARTIPVAIAGRDLTINQDIKALTPCKELHGQFLAYLLKARETELLDKVTRGATVHKLDTPVIRSLQISLPPLEEQHQIVVVLDEAFEGLARARAHAEANLRDARELFDAIKRTVLHPEDSKALSLSNLVDVQSGFAFKSTEYTESGHFLIRIGNVQDRALNLHNPKFVALDKKTWRFALTEGDFLTSLTGNIGRVARVETEHLPAALNQRVARITAKPNAALIPEYLYYFLTSPLFSQPLIESGHGTAQQNVSPSEISGIEVLLPSLQQQKDIADQLGAFDASVSSLAETYRMKIADTDALRQSLLQSAFAGELT